MDLELESHDLLVTRALVQRVAGAATLVAAVIGIVYGVMTTSVATGAAAIFFGLAGLLLGPMIYASAGRDPNTRAEAAGRLRVEPENGALRLSRGNQRIDLTDIEGAWVEEDFVGGTLVVETRAGLTIAARFRDEQRERVDQILGALGADSRVIVMRLAAAERAGRGCAGGCLMSTLLVGALPAAAFLKTLIGQVASPGYEPAWLMVFGIPTLLCLMVVWASARALTSTRLRVGADGVGIGRRFIPYDELREVRHATNGVVFETDTRKHKVRCLGVQAAAVVMRVQQALARYQDADKSVDLHALDRAQHSFGQWRAALANVLERSTYRTRALDKSDLLALVENPRAPVERRAGAILALAPHVSDDERQRVRIASEACADDHTRAVLEAALEEELDELETALRKVQTS